jgi:hypothetical protein
MAVSFDGVENRNNVTRIFYNVVTNLITKGFIEDTSTRVTGLQLKSQTSALIDNNCIPTIELLCVLRYTDSDYPFLTYITGFFMNFELLPILTDYGN